MLNIRNQTIRDDPLIPRSLDSYPTGTQGSNNVISMSMQRYDVASTLMRRCLNLMCQLVVSQRSDISK